jgi:hypothetical protein
VRRCRCGSRYRASESRDARASYWHKPAGSILSSTPLVTRFEHSSNSLSMSKLSKRIVKRGFHPGYPRIGSAFVCSVCMVRILCAILGQVNHENGVPPLVLGNARPVVRLQWFLFWAFPDFRPFLRPTKTPFFYRPHSPLLPKRAFSTASETVENPETPKTSCLICIG